MTVPRDGRAARSRAPARRSPARRRARSRSRTSSRSGSGCARPPSPTRTAPPTTRPPRSRRTSSSRSRARRSGSPRPPASSASCSPRSCAPRSRTGSGSAPRDALTGPIARGDEATVARQRAAVAGARARPARRCSTRWSTRRGRSPAARRSARAAGGRVVRTLRTIAEVRAHVAAARRAGRTVGLVPTMGAFHAGHEALMRAAREQCDDVIVSLFVNPAQFDDAARPDARTRAARSATPRSRRSSASTRCSRRRSRRSTPTASRRAIRVAGLGDVLEGAERGAAPLRGRLHRRLQAVQHRRARRRVLRPEGRPAGRRDAPHGARPRHPRAARRSSRPCASPTASRSPRATPASTPTDRERALALSRGLEAVRDAVEAGERDAAAAEAAGRAAMDGAGARVPRRRRPGDAGACARRSTAGYSWSWRPASGRHG